MLLFRVAVFLLLIISRKKAGRRKCPVSTMNFFEELTNSRKGFLSANSFSQQSGSAVLISTKKKTEQRGR